MLVLNKWISGSRFGYVPMDKALVIRLRRMYHSETVIISSLQVLHPTRKKHGIMVNQTICDFDGAMLFISPPLYVQVRVNYESSHECGR